MTTVMDKNSRIFVAGHSGLVGSAIMRRLRDDGYNNVITRPHNSLDLTQSGPVNNFFGSCYPEYVFLAAAKVGGILANCNYGADFIRDNLLIQTIVIDAANRHNTKKLLFLGSSCIYPKLAPQPIKEEHLLSSELEPTNECYAIAKIAGIKMCQAYRRQYGLNAISLMPTNLYGPHDNFGYETSHALPAIMRKIHDAKESGADSVTLWGSGSPCREFLHVDDLADACLFLMHNYDDEEIINVGVGEDISIFDLAEMIKEIVGFDGEIVWDKSKPDGTPRKLLDVNKLSSLGWEASIPLREGIRETYQWLVYNFDAIKGT